MTHVPLAMHLSLKAEYILHVEQAALAGGDPARRADGAAGEGHARGGLVGDLDPLAEAGEEDGVIADDVTGTDGLEADGLAVTLAGVALAAIDGALLEVAAEGG